jgi:hypothetical protein
MTWDEAVIQLNEHAENCSVCATCRMIGSTLNCCEVGQELLKQIRKAADDGVQLS